MKRREFLEWLGTGVTATASGLIISPPLKSYFFLSKNPVGPIGVLIPIIRIFDPLMACGHKFYPGWSMESRFDAEFAALKRQETLVLDIEVLERNYRLPEYYMIDVKQPFGWRAFD